ncbi:hypothetical protein V8C26DRAFT_405947 [Trichoderma gracile]
MPTNEACRPLFLMLIHLSLPQLLLIKPPHLVIADAISFGDLPVPASLINNHWYHISTGVVHRTWTRAELGCVLPQYSSG